MDYWCNCLVRSSSLSSYSLLIFKKFWRRLKWSPKNTFRFVGYNSPGEEEEAKPITVKFARPETDRARKAREKSFKFMQQKMAEEPWTKVQFHHFGVSCRSYLPVELTDVFHSELVVFSFLSLSPKQRNLNVFGYSVWRLMLKFPSLMSHLKLIWKCLFQMQQTQMCRLFVKIVVNFFWSPLINCSHFSFFSITSSSPKPNMSSNVISMAQLRTLPLGDQIRSILIRGE